MHFGRFIGLIGVVLVLGVLIGAFLRGSSVDEPLVSPAPISSDGIPSGGVVSESLDDVSAPIAEVMDEASGSVSAEAVQSATVDTRASISGRVYDVSTGEGIAGIMVMADGSGDFFGVTNQNGEYTISSLVPGNWDVRVSNFGPVHFPHEMVRRQYMTISELGELKGPDFGLDIGYSLTARVEDATGTPIEDAVVRLRTEQNSGSTYTDVDGRFRFLGTLTDLPQTLTARKPGYALTKFESIDVLNQGKSDVVLVLDEGSSISGRVVDQDGEGVARAEVFIFDESGTLVNEDYSVYPIGVDGYDVGGFDVDNLTNGTYQFYINIEPTYDPAGGVFFGLRDPDSADIPNAVVTVGRGEHRNDVVLKVNLIKPASEDLLTIEGTVRNEDGEYISDARVSASNITSLTDKQGYFKVVVPRSWDHASFDVSSEGYKTVYLYQELKDGERVDFVLESISNIRGRVMDSITGEPVPRYFVGLVGNNRKVKPLHTPGAEYVSDSLGKFSVLYSHDFPINVRVHADGYQPLTMTVETVEDGIPGLEFNMIPGPILHGVVLDSTERPVANVQVSLGTMDDVTYRNPYAGGVAFTDADGNFSFSVLTDDVAKLLIRHRDYVRTVVPVELVSGKSHEVTIRLGTGGSLEGIVYWGDRPMSGQLIEITSTGDGGRLSATSDEYGRYRIDTLLPGAYRIHTYFGVKDSVSERYIYKNQQEDTLLLHGTEVLNYDIRFRLWDTKIEGKIEDVDDRVDILEVFFTSREHGLWSVWGKAEIFEDGYYRMKHLPPETLEMSVNTFRGDGLIREKEVEVLPIEGETVELNIEFDPLYIVTGMITYPNRARGVAVFAYSGEVGLEDMGDAESVGLASTNEAGRYTLGVGTPGVYTIFAQVQYRDRMLKTEPALAVVHVQSGEILELDFEF